MKKSITTGIVVLAVLFVGYQVTDALRVSYKASHFGGGLSHELEAIGKGPGKTLEQHDADLCKTLKELGQSANYQACN